MVDDEQTKDNEIEDIKTPANNVDKDMKDSITLPDSSNYAYAKENILQDLPYTVTAVTESKEYKSEDLETSFIGMHKKSQIYVHSLIFDDKLSI